MKTKLQLGIIVVLLAFLGTYIEQTVAPNQQVVIQFSNSNISSEEAENTIEAVKEQLQSIGVSQINIGQHEDGKLRITYYSEEDVNRIQNILSEEEGLKLAYQSNQNRSNDFPDDNGEKDYELNISEIQNGSDTNWDFEGIQITEFNHKSDRFSNPTDNLSGKDFNVDVLSASIKINFEVNTSVVLAIDNISYIIPEVRAGPTNGEFII